MLYVICNIKFCTFLKKEGKTMSCLLNSLLKLIHRTESNSQHFSNLFIIKKIIDNIYLFLLILLIS